MNIRAKLSLTFVLLMIFGVTAISISLTHTEHYAAAFAILTIVAPPAESATLLHKTNDHNPPP